MRQYTLSLQRIPRGVVALGFVSLFMDVSSEMVYGLLPFFLVNVLKTSVGTFGLIQGAAEASTAITKLFSGVVSDWWGKRTPLILVGYGLAALVRPIFRSQPQQRRYSALVSSIASARGSVARPVTRWLPTSPRPIGAAPPSGCDNPWIAWAPSWGP